MFTPASLGHGRRGACCRRARFEDGIDRFTLRFADPMREDGFAHAHKAPLCNYTTLAMVALVASSFLGGLIAHRFWDNAQYPTAEARELSRWQLRIGMMMTTPCALALGSGILLARYNIISTLGLEIIVVSASTCYMIVMVIIPKHYMARLFGHGDPEDIWGVDLGGTDGQTVLYIDCVVTALHLLLPIRWMILFPMEVIAVLAYTVPALLLGSPAMNIRGRNNGIEGSCCSRSSRP
ncbi:unnamed protein product [Prorocentrum cordatum]|uniref:Uncharacterized protein n=1 Tax=Prorocentrum cordatum TaxID=2364126 RepID=A0ABN9P9X9_9DINO|nr:unnamed protein product [Polarella glacialis]